MAEPIGTEAFIAPTFGQRLGGRILDGILMAGIFVPLALVLHGTAVRVIVGLVITAAYEIISVAVWGQTIGKRIVGTRVVSAVADDLEPWQAVVRFLALGGGATVVSVLGARWIGELWILIAILPILRSPMHRGVHDYAARTIVVPTRTWSAR